MVEKVSREPQIDGYVLAGGLSRRMGTNKAFLPLGGKTMLGWASDALFAVSKTVRVVGDVPLGSTELTVVPDRTRNKTDRGAIVGLLTALLDARHDQVAILACDLPFVTGELMRQLAAIASETPKADCVIPRQSDGRLQPLCGIYRKHRCAGIVDSIYNDGEWRLQHVMSCLNTRTVEFRSFSDLPGSPHFFFNVNTGDDFQQAAKLAAFTM